MLPCTKNVTLRLSKIVKTGWSVDNSKTTNIGNQLTLRLPRLQMPTKWSPISLPFWFATFSQCKLSAVGFRQSKITRQIYRPRLEASQQLAHLLPTCLRQLDVFSVCSSCRTQHQEIRLEILRNVELVLSFDLEKKFMCIWNTIKSSRIYFRD